VRGRDLMVDLDHLETVFLVQDLHRREGVLGRGQLAGGIDLQRQQLAHRGALGPRGR
jgi:hypothetical protein